MPWQLFQRLFPGETHHEAGLREEIGRCLPEHGRLLDLGCGRNALLASFAGPGREVWGTDFERHPHLERPDWFRPLDADGTIPFPDRHFDLITAVMVLEHVERPQHFLAEISRVLRPGGSFIGHTISGTHYVTWARRLFDLVPHSVTQRLVRRLYGRDLADTFPTHYRLNRPGQIRLHTRGTGLELVRLRRYADPGYFRFHPHTLRAAMFLDRGLEMLGAGLGRLYFTVVLRKTRASQARATRASRVEANGTPLFPGEPS